MGRKLTEHQMMIVKGMVEYAQAFADAMYLVMKNHGLDGIDGCRLDVTITPEHLFMTETIHMGWRETEFGSIELSKGRKDNDFHIEESPDNSPELERLFTGEADRVALDQILPSEKPFPPDGLWVGGSGNDSPVGNWEWDVNDSLS